MPLPKAGGIVLYGGQSRRMGRSKAWLECGREHLLQRVVRLVSEAVGPVVAAGRADQALPPLPADVTVVHDAVADSGPLAGIAAGLDALAGRCEAAFVVACDHPLLKPRFITRLLELVGEHQAVVPSHEGRLHPVTAVYRLETRDLLADMLKERTLAATAFAERCAARVVHQDAFVECDPQLDSLRSFNDPREYDVLLRELAREQQ